MISSPTIEKHGDAYRLVYEDVYATGIRDLWEAVTTRDRLARWMETYDGDLRLGGVWTVNSTETDEVWATGAVLACDAPHSFTTTWHWTGEDATELTVTLAEVDGGTRLRLEHTGIRSIFYGPGWQTYLEQLSTHVTGAPVGDQDWWNARYAELTPSYRERFAAL